MVSLALAPYNLLEESLLKALSKQELMTSKNILKYVYFSLENTSLPL